MNKFLLLFSVLFFVACDKESENQDFLQNRVWFRLIKGKKDKRFVYFDSKGTSYSWKGMKSVSPTLKNIGTPKTATSKGVAKGWHVDYDYKVTTDSLFLNSPNGSRKNFRFKFKILANKEKGNVIYNRFTVVNNRKKPFFYYSKKKVK